MHKQISGKLKLSFELSLFHSPSIVVYFLAGTIFFHHHRVLTIAHKFANTTSYNRQKDVVICLSKVYGNFLSSHLPVALVDHPLSGSHVRKLNNKKRKSKNYSMTKYSVYCSNPNQQIIHPNASALFVSELN